jgi:hypothetical protein
MASAASWIDPVLWAKRSGANILSYMVRTRNPVRESTIKDILFTEDMTTLCLSEIM